MRLREHIRSNVVGYIALFAFAMSGTASALDGSDTVFSDDIVDGEVKSAEIGPNAVRTNQIRNGQVRTADLGDENVTKPKLATDSVTGAKLLDGTVATADLADGAVSANKMQDGAITSAKVLDDSQAGGGLGPSDLATNAVGPAEIATDAVGATEIQDNSIDSGEVVDFGLTNQDIGVLFAEVTSTGVLSNSSGGGVTVTKLTGSGTYEVDFARKVNSCTAVATIGGASTGTALGEVNVADRTGHVEAVFVDTNNSDGTAADKPFRLVVVC